MQVTKPNSVKIYNLSAGKSIPEWLDERKKRQLLKQDSSLRQRITLLQDFEMPTLSTQIEISADEQYVLAVGTYKPRVRCYDVHQLSMKFERCLDSEVTRMRVLSEDYTKLAFLRADRTIEFHAASGFYYRTRVPRCGRDMVYRPSACELCVCANGGDIYRLNLEEGRFLNTLQVDVSSKRDGAATCADVNIYHDLLACGTTDGTVECFDARSRDRVAKLVNYAHSEGQARPAVTALCFRDALNMAVGDASGVVRLYDLRASKPYAFKDHRNGLPVRCVAFHQGNAAALSGGFEGDLVLSADTKALKIWHRNEATEYGDARLFTAIEPGSRLNHFRVVGSSGLLFMAHDEPRVGCYYIPQLGAAPRWCAFLDSITEELEEGVGERDASATSGNRIYDDYRFVTRGELEAVGLSDLIGTSQLRSAMHGFFVEASVFDKARRSALERDTLFKFDDFRRKQVDAQIEAERNDRLTDALANRQAEAAQLDRDAAKWLRRHVTTNRDFATRLLGEAQSTVAQSGAKKRERAFAAELLNDNRFGDLFRNADFRIDTDSDEYRLLNPVVQHLERARKKKLARLAEAESNDEDDAEDGDERAPKATRPAISAALLESLDEAAAREMGVAPRRDAEAETNQSRDVSSRGIDRLDELLRKRSRKSDKKPKRTKRSHQKDDGSDEGEDEEEDARVAENPAAAAATDQALGKRVLAAARKSDVTQRSVVRDARTGRSKLVEMVADESGGNEGERTVTFRISKLKNATPRSEDDRLKQHIAERRQLVRSGKSISRTIKDPPKFWMGKRVQ